MKILFVGGPKDGKREFFPTNYGNLISVSVFPPSDSSFSSCVDDSIYVQTHTYELKKFVGEGKTYEAAFHSTIKNPMEALIKGYRYHRNPRYGRPRRISKIP